MWHCGHCQFSGQNDPTQTGRHLQRHLHWTQSRRSESTKDRPHTALYQGIDAVLKDLVAAPEACRRVTCGMMCCDVLRTLSIVTYCYTLISFDTSSTAQGGGGSFKNRKPIGEIGCCESGMAERIHWWTERCLRSPLFLSLSLTIYLPTYLSSMYLSIYRSIYLSLSFI